MAGQGAKIALGPIRIRTQIWCDAQHNEQRAARSEATCARVSAAAERICWR